MGRLSPRLSWSTSEPPADSPVTVPPTVNFAVVQVTATLVTLADAVPVPPETTQVWTGMPGWVRTVTEYAPPAATGVRNVKLPLVVRERLSPRLSWRTTVPARPEIEPPMVKGPPASNEPSTPPSPPICAVQVTSTVVTLAPAIVPLAIAIVQFSPAGWVSTVTR